MKRNKRILAVLLSPLLFWVSLAGVVLRTLQLTLALDHSTGFYRNWHFSIPLLDDLLIVGGILFGVIAFFLRKEEFTGEFPKRSFWKAVLFLLCAVGISGQTVLQLVFMTELSIITFLSFLTSALCLIGFFVLAAQKEPLSVKSTKVLVCRSILPALWGCLQMIKLFFEESSLANTSEYVFAILFLSCATVFFIKFGALSFERDDAPRGFLLLLSGILTALFGCVVSLPSFLSCFLGAMPWENLSPLSCAALPVSLLGFVFVFKNTADLRKKH